MSARLILCEGKHALSALDGLLTSVFGCEEAGGPTPDWFKPTKGSGQTLRTYQTATGVELYTQTVGSKSNLRPALKLRLESAARFDHIGLCFDADEQDESAWRSSIESALSKGWTREGRAYRVPASTGDIAVVPLPWSVAAGERLYDVVARGLASAHPDRGALVKRWQTDAIGGDPATDAKAACWFWMSGWHSTAECDHFFRSIMESYGRTFMNGPSMQLIAEGLKSIAT